MFDFITTDHFLAILAGVIVGLSPKLFKPGRK